MNTSINDLKREINELHEYGYGLQEYIEKLKGERDEAFKKIELLLQENAELKAELEKCDK